MSWDTTWSAIEALATAGGLGFAGWSIRAIKTDSRDRTRPVMSAELIPGVLTHAKDLRVANVGQSVAKNVRVTFKPPLPNNLTDEADMATWIARRYANPIPTVTPGMTMLNVYRSAIETPPRDSTTEMVRVTFHYEDEHGRKYEDAYELSVTLLGFTTTSNPAGSETSFLKRTVKALEAIARGVGRHD